MVDSILVLDSLGASTEQETRVCSKCPKKGPQPLSAFAKNPRPGKPDNRRTTCKACCNEYFRNSRKNPPPKRKLLTDPVERLRKKREWAVNTKHKRLYGLTRAQRLAMYEAQNGLCAICGKPET